MEVVGDDCRSGDTHWTDYSPYWRHDLDRFIWVPDACGAKRADGRMETQWETARQSTELQS